VRGVIGDGWVPVILSRRTARGAGGARMTLSFRAGGTPEAWSAARNPPRTMENQGIAGDPSLSSAAPRLRQLGMTGLANH
jgi:hypothetical protein